MEAKNHRKRKQNSGVESVRRLKIFHRTKRLNAKPFCSINLSNLGFSRQYICNDLVPRSLPYLEYISAATTASDSVEFKQGKEYGDQENGDFRFNVHFPFSFPIPQLYKRKTAKKVYVWAKKMFSRENRKSGIHPIDSHSKEMHAGCKGKISKRGFRWAVPCPASQTRYSPV